MRESIFIEDEENVSLSPSLPPSDIFEKGVDMMMYWCTTKNADVREAIETAVNRRRR
jgi:hypothetical protein